MDDQLASILIKYQEHHEKLKANPEDINKSRKETEQEIKHQENLKHHKELIGKM